MCRRLYVPLNSNASALRYYSPKRTTGAAQSWAIGTDGSSEKAPEACCAGRCCPTSAVMDMDSSSGRGTCAN